MNSKQLQYFLITAKAGSIAAAARELDIAQPAISQQLANLEREMGAPLFHRSFKGVSLTEAGDIFAKHARKLVDDINAAKAELRYLTDERESTVKVGMLPSIGNVLSMSLIAEAELTKGKLKLDISTGPSYSVRGWLEKNEIDIAITYEQDIDPAIMVCQPLIEEYMYLVVGANEASAVYQSLKDRNSIAFWELSEFALLSPGERDALGKLIQDYEKQTGVALNYTGGYSGQLMTAFRQLLQSESAMILPSSAIFHLEESGLVKALKIEQPEMKRQVYLATSRSVTLSDSNLKMQDVIRRVAAQEQALNHWRGRLHHGRLTVACA
ncbi:LysR family transcriptional regulator [Aestuariibacter sp. A3R04]|uniref:LysR family transcriptional regulator n=1 Tax=Aestuariibacter sp. A3R04 TaxID=2841571 RepID=UPI001C0951FD|nr:LysR family transcriptional regulator [Aestuariibacter sp. A3R04]MBU3021178.1 LysR family transcriptional regulator [Aestuariibacter sp. A3R04]